MDSNILEYVLAAAVPAITLLMVWGVKKLIAYWDSKIEAVKASTNNDILKTYINIVHDNAVTVVKNLNQTIVDDLKAASADGKLTKEDAVKIKEDAIDLLYSTLSEDILNVINKIYGDTNNYLSLVIERVVKECHK